MRKIALIAAILGGLFVSGCTTTDGGGWLSEAAKRAGDVGETTKRNAGKAIDAYCMNVPSLARMELRAQVNEYAELGRVTVECRDAQSGQ